MDRKITSAHMIRLRQILHGRKDCTRPALLRRIIAEGSTQTGSFLHRGRLVEEWPEVFKFNYGIE